MFTNTLTMLANELASRHSESMMDLADECYLAMFRSADPIVADEEIAESLVHARIQKIIRALEAKGLTEWQLENELDNLPEIDASEFMGMQVYPLCNYKGEGEGYCLKAEGEHLPVFVSKTHSFNQYGC